MTTSPIQSALVHPTLARYPLLKLFYSTKKTWCKEHAELSIQMIGSGTGLPVSMIYLITVAVTLLPFVRQSWMTSPISLVDYIWQRSNHYATGLFVMDFFPKKYYPSFYFQIYFLYFSELALDTVCFSGELCKLWYLKRSRSTRSRRRNRKRRSKIWWNHRHYRHTRSQIHKASAVHATPINIHEHDFQYEAFLRYNWFHVFFSLSPALSLWVELMRAFVTNRM